MTRDEIIHARIQTEPFDPGQELTALVGRDASAGAVASFVGQVRQSDELQALVLEHHPTLTEPVLVRIAEAAAQRWNLTRVRITHRVGRMDVGAAIVFVGAAASHRRAALEAASYLIDVLKTQAPFWKKEITSSGDRWIEPTPEDAAAAARWLDDPVTSGA